MGSTLDPEGFPHGRPRKSLKGHDVRVLGPSDSSDTGADMAESGPLDDTSDRGGTGERSSVDAGRARSAHDIDTDRVVDAEEAGLGDGSDEIDEAWLEHDRGEH